MIRTATLTVVLMALLSDPEFKRLAQ